MLSNGNLSTHGIAVLAGFDQPLGLAPSRGVNWNEVLLLGSRVEEVARHRGRILSPPQGHFSEMGEPTYEQLNETSMAGKISYDVFP